MLDKRQNNDNILFRDMPLEDQHEWFGYAQKKFLHNIDTFYYSVKFRNDFRLKSKDPQVEKMRKFFKLQYSYLNGNEDQPELYLPKLGKNLYLKPVTFSRFYTTCLSYPEYFDIFLAPVVPKAADGGESVTCECVVQIRSYMLWIMGVKDAFENSYEYVKNIAAYFGLEIEIVQENRVDYCWHSNYLKDPETFFSPENFYKMRVDRFKNATYVTNKVGSEDYEIDYVALGKRSDKVFVRIYQKTVAPLVGAWIEILRIPKLTEHISGSNIGALVIFLQCADQKVRDQHKPAFIFLGIDDVQDVPLRIQMMYLQVTHFLTAQAAVKQQMKDTIIA